MMGKSVNEKINVVDVIENDGSLDLEKVRDLWRSVGQIWYESDDGYERTLDALNDDRTTTLLAYVDSELAGLLHAMDNGLVAYLCYLVVDPAFQRSGVGARLLAAFDDKFFTFHRHIMADNVAVDFYRKLGYGHDGEYTAMAKWACEDDAPEIGPGNWDESDYARFIKKGKLLIRSKSQTENGLNRAFMFSNPSDIIDFLSSFVGDLTSDAHIHLLPQSVHDRYPNMDDVYKQQSVSVHSTVAKCRNIQRAVIMPYNDPFMFCLRCDQDPDLRPNIEQVNEEIVKLTATANDAADGCRYFFAADVDPAQSLDDNLKALQYAVSNGCVGVKFHPVNSQTDANSKFYIVVAGCASSLNLPVFVHSFVRHGHGGTGDHDPFDSIDRVLDLMRRAEDAVFVICHAGGDDAEKLAAVLREEPDLSERVFVDFSAIRDIWIRENKLEQMFDIFDRNHILNASDWPWRY